MEKPDVCPSEGNSDSGCNRTENASSTETSNSQDESSGFETGDNAANECLTILKQASSDTEKFAALFSVTKLLKSNEINEKMGKKLINTIGFTFLGRLLGTTDVPQGCPPYMFKSIALSILGSFIHTCYYDAKAHRLIPLLSEITTSEKIYDEDLTLVKDAYFCLNIFASHHSGRKALIDHEVLGSLVDSYISENMYYEQALEIIRKIVRDKQCNIWEDEPEAFTKLMEYLCKEFSTSQNEHNFFLCEVLADIIPSMISEFDKLYNMGSWNVNLHKGLSEILFSKLDQDRRNKGMYLASVVLEFLGASFIVDGEKGRQLLLLMVHFACIEVRLSLEDKSFEESISMAFQTTACYSIIEEAIKFLINGAISLEEKQKQQLYSALKGAFNGVLEFLGGASCEDESLIFYKNQMFISASIRVLGAWIAEETTANKEQVYNVLPFLLKVTKHNFTTTKSLKSSKTKSRNELDEFPDLVRFLLPGFCHLTVEDRPRQILIDFDMEKFLYEYLIHQWEIICSTLDKDVYMPNVSINSDSLITLCNIFMNLVVQESKRVQENAVYFCLMKFIFLKAPEVAQKFRNLHLTGTLTTLGLLILRYNCSNIHKMEVSVCRFIQTCVRFLWDGFNVEESNDYATLVVSASYQEQWNDLIELWYLSIHTLTTLLPKVSWIVNFLIESEWPQTIIETLLLVKSDGIEESVKIAYEDMLCSLIEASPATKEILVIKGVRDAIKNHKLVKLSHLFPSLHAL